MTELLAYVIKHTTFLWGWPGTSWNNRLPVIWAAALFTKRHLVFFLLSVGHSRPTTAPPCRPPAHSPRTAPPPPRPPQPRPHTQSSGAQPPSQHPPIRTRRCSGSPSSIGTATLCSPASDRTRMYTITDGLWRRACIQTGSQQTRDATFKAILGRPTFKRRK